MSIRSKIVAIFLVSALIPFGLIATFIYVDIKTAVEKSALEKVDSLATIQKARTIELVKKYTNQIEQFTTRLQLRQELALYNKNRNKSSQIKIGQIITEAKKGSLNIKDISILDTKGVVVSSTSLSEVGKNHSEKIFFKKGSIRKNTSEFFKIGRQVYLHLSGPLILDEVKLGVVAIDISTEDLFSLFGDYSGLGKTASWGLAISKPDGDGLIVVPGRFDPDPDSPLKTTIAKTSQVPLIRALRGEERIIPNIRNYQGKEVVAATRFIKDLGWGIGVTQERTEVFGLSYGLANQLVFFIGILLIFVGFLSSVFSQIISAPIIALSQTAAQISAGDLTARAAAGANDELGRLARSFNEMTGKLETSYKFLEKKVAERTRDLQKFKLALDGASDHITISDSGGVIIYANRAVERMTGFAKKEVIGRKAGSKNLWGGLMAKDFYERLWKRVKYEKKVFTCEMNNKRKDGSIFFTFSSIYPICNTDGEVDFFVEIHRDITREKEIEKMKDEFIGIASHQLRTPLAAIDGLVSMIREGQYGKVNKELQDPLKDISQSSERMIYLVNDLLNLSRLSAGGIQYKMSSFVLKPVIGDLVKMLEPIYQKKHITLKLMLDDKIMVYADPDRVREITVNLLNNALKFTAKGSVWVKARKNKDKVVVLVEDTGIGIIKEDRPKLFEKFGQIESKIKVLRGTGLGLHIARAMARGMGGEVWLERSEQGKGSVFAFSLRLANKYSSI